MNGGLLYRHTEDVGLLWRHREMEEHIWSQRGESYFRAVTRRTLRNKNKNLFHSQAGNTNQQLSESEGKCEYSALNLFMIKTDVGLGVITLSLKGCLSSLWMLYKYKMRALCRKKKQRRWGRKPACSLVLSNRSISRSALLRSSFRSSSSWLIRPWEERNTWKVCRNIIKLIYIALRCHVDEPRGHDESIPWGSGEKTDSDFKKGYWVIIYKENCGKKCSKNKKIITFEKSVISKDFVQ